MSARGGEGWTGVGEGGAGGGGGGQAAQRLMPMINRNDSALRQLAWGLWIVLLVIGIDHGG